MADLLSDADVGFGAAPKLLSDADVGFAPAAKQAVGDMNPAMTEFPTYAAPASSEPAPGNAAVERVGKVAKDAFLNTQLSMKPDMEEAINNGGPIGRHITTPAIHAMDVARGAGNAGMAALSQAAMEVFGEKGGRDALALLSVLPMAGGERMSPNVAAPAEVAPRPQFVSERMAPNISELDPRNAAQALITHDITENPVIPGRSADFGTANQSLAEIGRAPDIDTAIEAAGRAAQAPSGRAMTEWMQPLSKAATPPEEPALTGEVLPPETAARPQSMADYLKANSVDAVEPSPPAGEALPPSAHTGPITTSADAKAVANAWYQKADHAGAELPPAFSDDLVDSAEKIAPQTSVGRAVAGDTEVTKLVDRLQAIRGEPITLQGAQEIYESLGDAISKEYGLKGLSKDGYNLMNLQTKFWNMIQNADPAQVAGGTEGFQAWAQGRDAWAQAMKMIDVERIINRAEQTDNPATSIKSGVRVLLNSNRIRGFDPEEIAALKDAGNRGVIGGVLHVFGSRLIPYAAGAAGAVGGPVGAITAAGAGYLGSTMMRNAATALQSRRIGNALSVLGEGVPPAP